MMIIYHNPKCQTSRKVLALLQNNGFEPTVIDYLKTPLSWEELKYLSDQLALKDFVRSHEPAFKALGLTLDNEAEVLQAMLKEPKLMQRPIIIFKNKVMIGRPPERVLELLK